MEMYPTPYQVDRATSTAAATAVTLSSALVSPGSKSKLVAVLVAYSAASTASITITLDSAAGADYDVRLATIDLVTQQWGVYTPDQKIPLGPGDRITVTAPAGAATAFGRIMIYTEPEFAISVNPLTYAGSRGYNHGDD